MDIWVPLKEKEKKKINQNIQSQIGVRTYGRQRPGGESFFLSFFFFYSFFSDLRKSDRRNSSG